MWDFDFDQGDSFINIDFNNDDDDNYGNMFGDFGTSTMAAPEPVMATEIQRCQPARKSGRQTEDSSSAIVSENDVLRETAMKLKERFTKASSENQTLRAQLEECRSRFRNAMFSGIIGAKK